MKKAYTDIETDITESNIRLELFGIKDIKVKIAPLFLQSAFSGADKYFTVQIKSIRRYISSNNHFADCSFTFVISVDNLNVLVYYNVNRGDENVVSRHIRGVESECPENTFAAFKRAVCQGYDVIELDLCRNKG